MKVSIVIPTYNKADLTVEAIRSVLNQTYKDIEIIVVDDGSTDDTSKKIEPFLSDNLTYIYQQNQGVSNARNRGIKYAKGDYIAFLDCDDMYLPHKIEKSLKVLEYNDFVYTDAYFINGDKRLHRSKGKNLLLGNFICNSTLVAHKRCLGEFDEDLFTHADWDMSLRLFDKYKGGYIAEPFTYYRVGSDYILRHLKQSKREGLRVLEKAFQRRHYNWLFKMKCIFNVYLRNWWGYIKAWKKGYKQDK